MIMLTGGSGRLGTEIQKIMGVWAPSQKEFDITAIGGAQARDIRNQVLLIIHAAAYTNVDQAEKERELCYQTNVIGTRNVVRIGVPVLYISTDSVFDGEAGDYAESDIPYPRNFYSMTKLLAEQEIREGAIIRCSPRSRPWDREGAFTDRFFSAEYMDETARHIKRAAAIFKMLPRIVHVGSARRSHYEMALLSKPDVRAVQGEDPSGLPRGKNGVWRGRDLSLDCSLWRALK